MADRSDLDVRVVEYVSGYGIPSGISIGGWTVLQLSPSSRTSACVELVVEALRHVPAKYLRRILDAAKEESCK